MPDIRFSSGKLDEPLQQRVSAGFQQHSEQQSAPPYNKQSINWTLFDEDERCIAVLTAEDLWDWIYIDELWVDHHHRGSGYGKLLMDSAEAYARTRNKSGLWLWTQSWQAATFYERLGYSEFTRFENFPRGHSRIGFRKELIVE